MKRFLVAASLMLACSAALTQAVTTPSQGNDALPAPAVTPGPGSGPGMGRGAGRRSMRFGPSNTPGWSMMSPQERQTHRDRMYSFKTVDECKAYHDEHVKLMEARAKERHRRFTPAQTDPCSVMQQRGLLK